MYCVQVVEGRKLLVLTLGMKKEKEKLKGFWCMNNAVTIRESINAASLLNNHYKSSIGVEHFT